MPSTRRTQVTTTILHIILLAPLMLLLAGADRARAQFFRFAPGVDTTKTVSLEGYADVYYGYDFSEPQGGDRPYFVNHHRHHEVNVNLAYLSARYTSPRARAVITPGVGTYMNANYAAERQTLQHIVEASIGVKLRRTKNIWLDAGVLPSPYTNESAISFDQPTLTRSFASEYVPYFLAGARLRFPLSPSVVANLYLLNGWQKIEKENTPLAFGSSVEWRPDTAIVVVANTYVGSERTLINPQARTRYFLDAYLMWKLSSRWSMTASIYAGAQSRVDTAISDFRIYDGWGQANATARYTWNGRSSISARAEYFRDPAELVITRVTALLPTERVGFGCFSGSLGYNVFPTPNLLMRTEARYFHAPIPVFIREGAAYPNNFVVTTGIAVKF